MLFHSFHATLVALLLTLVSVHAQNHNVLFFSRTVEFRHDSIPTALQTFQTLADRHSAFNPIFTEDPSFFTPENLSDVSAIVFVSTSGQVLDTEEQMEAFLNYLTGGGGFFGIHLASGTFYNSPFYGNFVGSYFTYHPEFQNATFFPTESHKSVRQVPEQWRFGEEVYNFQSDPRDVNATVVIAVDPESYDDPNAEERGDPDPQGTPHPISWYREGSFDVTNGTSEDRALALNGTSFARDNVSTIATGRTYYTGLGHSNESWNDPLFQSYINDCLEWVLNVDSTPDRNATSTSSDSPTESVETDSGLALSHVAFKKEQGVVLLSAVLFCIGASTLFSNI